ncbi:MAG: zf-HC2 domain-containing protein [Myxococcales bacterium]|nr:zf-HC2 domain-containing protein [Myxococcales bacterium]
MNCRELKTAQTPYLDGELIAEARQDVEAHLATCPACAKRVEIERHNLTVIKQASQDGSPKAPQTLRSRVFDSVRQDDTRRRRVRAIKLSAAAAGLTLAVVAANHQYRAFQRSLFERDAALRHARQFPLEIQKPHAQDIERWFGGKLDYPVNVPRFVNATAAGARLLQVRDKPAAYIRYDAPRPMGLFVYGDDHEVDVGAEPAVGSSNGFNVVSWRNGDVVYQLVTDLEEQDIRELLPPPPGATTPVLDVRPAALQR